ncbi:hypothetical protein EV183_003466 [Coemansia sp. RSA 2336]|nr:hypothetical protein EV183_003466 [Coemansia sp. RSA 2336]
MNNHLVWNRIALEVYKKYCVGTGKSSIYRTDERLRRQRDLLWLAGINRLPRAVFSGLIIKEMAILLDADRRFFTNILENQKLLSRAKCIWIKLEHWPGIQADEVVDMLIECLPSQLSWTESIIVEADFAADQFTPVGRSISSQLDIPLLSAIHVICPASSHVAYTIAQTIAQLANKPSCDLLFAPNAIHDTHADTFVAPMWIGRQLERNDNLPISSLMFTDMELVPNAAALVRKCHNSLVELKFLHCKFEQLETLLYLDNKPVQYPWLRFIHGALSQTQQQDIRVPPNAFPRLEYVHEMVIHRWQYQAGVVSHLLINTLMGIRLPQLRMLRLRTSRNMTLPLHNLPALRYVRYYTLPELPESLDGRIVVEQFQRLLQVPTLHHLRFYDQLPTVSVLNDLQVGCTELTYLDIGMIVLSFRNIVHMLDCLYRLHTFMFALRNTWTSSQSQQLYTDMLSRSVERLKIYAVGTVPKATVLSPIEEIVSRLPRLAEVAVQEGKHALQAFMNRLKDEQKYSWSSAVADRICIHDTFK